MRHTLREEVNTDWWRVLVEGILEGEMACRKAEVDMNKFHTEGNTN